MRIKYIVFGLAFLIFTNGCKSYRIIDSGSYSIEPQKNKNFISADYDIKSSSNYDLIYIFGNEIDSVFNANGIKVKPGIGGEKYHLSFSVDVKGEKISVKRFCLSTATYYIIPFRYKREYILSIDLSKDGKSKSYKYSRTVEEIDGFRNLHKNEISEFNDAKKIVYRDMLNEFIYNCNK